MLIPPDSSRHYHVIADHQVEMVEAHRRLDYRRPNSAA
jgi:hypothetical protein